MTREDKLLRIRDLDGSKGRLEEALRLVGLEEGTIDNPADDELVMAMACISDAITKYDDELRKLES